MTLSEQTEALRCDKLTAAEAVSAALQSIQIWQSTLNAFVVVDEAQARASALASDVRRRSGRAASAMDGVPLAHKDMFDRLGHRCRFGSRLIQDPPMVGATVIERLEQAGTVTIGALNMSEFALGPTGHNAVFGHCRNPWDETRIAGGSSSGAAAAVAAGIVPGGIGSDSGGSIRIPAACCGVVGLKPTQGRVSAAGAMPLAPSLDCIGPLASNAVDCAALFRLIAGPDPRDRASLLQPPLEPAPPKLSSIRLAVPHEALVGEVDTEVATAVEEAARVFAAHGAQVSAARLPNVAHLHDLADVIQQSEVAAGHLDLLTLHRARYTPHIRRRIVGGLFVAAAAYLSALSQRAAHTAAFIADTLGDAHALILPVLGILVPRIDETDESVLGSGAPALIGHMTRWTRWLNYLGVPALSIPCGVDHRGMPIGLQLVGRPFSEVTLLEIARRFQEHTDWHVRRPRLRGL